MEDLEAVTHTDTKKQIKLKDLASYPAPALTRYCVTPRLCCLDSEISYKSTSALAFFTSNYEGDPVNADKPPNQLGTSISVGETKPLSDAS